MPDVATKQLWVFGYGSLIWRPDFPYLERRSAVVSGWTRRFWQGSHDHRGTPSAPGRVVTLVPRQHASCAGVAYRIDQQTANDTFAALDHREKNGYQRLELAATTSDGITLPTVTYVATLNNFAYLGPAPLAELSLQIASSHGPSGSNKDYLYALSDALRAMDVHDAHVFDLERQVRKLSQ